MFPVFLSDHHTAAGATIAVICIVLESTVGSGILVPTVGSMGMVDVVVGTVVAAVVGAVVVGAVLGTVLGCVLSFAWQPQAAREKVRTRESAIVKSFFIY